MEPKDAAPQRLSKADRKARRRHSQGDVSRRNRRGGKEQHLRLLHELDNLALAASCCHICHCDCFSSHRSSNVSVRAPSPLQLEPPKMRRRKSINSSRPTAEGDGSQATLQRCRSVTDLVDPPPRYSGRDCALLQDVFSSLPAVAFTTPRLLVSNANALKDVGIIANANNRNASPAPPPPLSTDELATLKLCDSLAELCLEPGVREAFQQVPTHDKKILNRMAHKRSERRNARDNAWLARKYWENERYERELLKCEQMAEYRRAIRDKQFQDYLLTRSRLRELAQRDREQLQRLRAELLAKDQRSGERLKAVRLERELQQCQRRCEELSKAEAVSQQQEELQLDEACRKQRDCERLGERMRHADGIREQVMGAHMRRLRYNNYVQQVAHEEHWRDARAQELHKIADLQAHIREKCNKAQRFVEGRRRRQAAVTQAAKISASLRELVRESQ